MIEVRGLRKIYPDGTVALDGIDLSFGDGMLGLLGPNGAGKTTLLSTLVLAQEPTAGQRTYFGLDDRTRHRPKIRPMIGYLPQEFHPISGLTGHEYLEYCADIRQVPLRRRDLRRRIAALFEAVELGHAAHRRADQYSGGMVRRLGLAQALIHGPRFLVVDEPTAGLDPEERIRFRNLITDLAEKIPVLLSTHIVEDIEATCPRLVIIARGRTLFDGPPSEVLGRVEGRLWRFPTGRSVPEGLLRVSQKAAAGGGAFQILCAPRQHSGLVDGAEPLEPTLEEACAAFLLEEAQVTLDDAADPEGADPESSIETSTVDP